MLAYYSATTSSRKRSRDDSEDELEAEPPRRKEAKRSAIVEEDEVEEEEASLEASEEEEEEEVEIEKTVEEDEEESSEEEVPAPKGSTLFGNVPRVSVAGAPLFRVPPTAAAPPTFSTTNTPTPPNTGTLRRHGAFDERDFDRGYYDAKATHVTLLSFNRWFYGTCRSQGPMAHEKSDWAKWDAVLARTDKWERLGDQPEVVVRQGQDWDDDEDPYLTDVQQEFIEMFPKDIPQGLIACAEEERVRDQRRGYPKSRVAYDS